MNIVEIPQEKMLIAIKNDRFRSLAEQALSDTLPDLLHPIETDPRFITNFFAVNDNFLQDPVFFIAAHINEAANSLIVASIYVYPKHRGKGVSKLVFRYIADLIPPNRSIQLSVEAEKLKTLDPYYKKLGFKTTGVKTLHKLGGYLVDYFWCKCYLELSMSEEVEGAINAARCGLRPESEWELYK